MSENPFSLRVLPQRGRKPGKYYWISTPL